MQQENRRAQTLTTPLNTEKKNQNRLNSWASPQFFKGVQQQHQQQELQQQRHHQYSQAESPLHQDMRLRVKNDQSSAHTPKFDNHRQFQPQQNKIEKPSMPESETVQSLISRQQQISYNRHLQQPHTAVKSSIGSVNGLHHNPSNCSRMSPASLSTKSVTNAKCFTNGPQNSSRLLPPSPSLSVSSVASSKGLLNTPVNEKANFTPCRGNSVTRVAKTSKGEQQEYHDQQHHRKSSQGTPTSWQSPATSKYFSSERKHIPQSPSIQISKTGPSYVGTLKMEGGCNNLPLSERKRSSQAQGATIMQTPQKQRTGDISSRYSSPASSQLSWSAGHSQLGSESARSNKFSATPSRIRMPYPPLSANRRRGTFPTNSSTPHH